MTEKWILALTVVDVVLLCILVVQGEYIRFYEREVYRLHSERDKERRDWREAKRKQAVKKADPQV